MVTLDERKRALERGWREAAADKMRSANYFAVLQRTEEEEDDEPERIDAVEKVTKKATVAEKVENEITVDSGSSESVAPPSSAPNAPLMASPGSF